MATRGFENFTATDAARHALKHTRQAIAGPRTPQAGRSKYGAVKTTVHGWTFDSKAEARRYLELLARAVVIRNLELQPRFPLKGADGSVVAFYVADFRYQESKHHHGPDGEFDAWTEDVVEDVKGMKTPVYRLKKKLFEAQYGITIREIR